MLRHFAILTAILAIGAAPALAVTWDTNDDGSVDAEEFARGNVASMTFDRFDDDGNGVISPAEVGLTEPDEIFLAGDHDGDGFLSRDEMTAATFGSYDVDRDAVLDRDELGIFEYDERARSRPFADHDAVRRGREISQ